MDRIQTRAMTGEDMVSLASFMGPEAERHGMTVRTCSEAADLSGFHIQKGKCIDDQLIAGLLGRPLDVKRTVPRGRNAAVSRAWISALTTPVPISADIVMRISARIRWR